MERNVSILALELFPRAKMTRNTLLFAASVRAEDDVDVDIDATVEEDLGKSRDGSRTDDEVVQRFVC